jgi:hypothetical protein
MNLWFLEITAHIFLFWKIRLFSWCYGWTFIRSFWKNIVFSKTTNLIFCLDRIWWIEYLFGVNFTKIDSICVSKKHSVSNLHIYCWIINQRSSFFILLLFVLLTLIKLFIWYYFIQWLITVYIINLLWIFVTSWSHILLIFFIFIFIFFFLIELLFTIFVLKIIFKLRESSLNFVIAKINY